MNFDFRKQEKNAQVKVHWVMTVFASCTWTILFHQKHFVQKVSRLASQFVLQNYHWSVKTSRQLARYLDIIISLHNLLRCANEAALHAKDTVFRNHLEAIAFRKKMKWLVFNWNTWNQGPSFCISVHFF